VIGVFSDSHGDLDAFDAAYQLLRVKGAERYFFAGGRYSDLDEWYLRKKEKARGGRSYSDADFLSDVSNFLTAKEQVKRPPAFGQAPSQPPPRNAAPAVEEDDLSQLMGLFLRTPEKASLQYRDPNINNKAMDMLGDSLCCVVHDKNDLTRDDLLNALVFIHGKESEPKVVQIGPRFFLSPGKLTGAAEQTCGLIEVVEKNLKYSAFTLDGRTLIDGQLCVLDRRTKLSVK
jgi:hypothetical protein